MKPIAITWKSTLCRNRGHEYKDATEYRVLFSGIPDYIRDEWMELADTSFGTVVLHGKNTNSSADNEYYEVSSEINTDGDFAITFFKTYEKMKKWFDEWQGEGFYNYLVELYEKQLTQ